MRKAIIEDKSRVIHIISESFDENKSINFVVKQDKKRKKRIKLLIEYSFFYGMQFGDIFLSEDEKACCILLFPEKKNLSFKRLYWDVKLLVRCIGLMNFIPVLKREFQLKKFYPKTPFIHLWYIGVLPGYQGNGKGTLLLAKVLELYKNSGKPFYLETSTLKNIPLYKRFGFETIGKIDSIGYTLFILRK